MTATPKPRVLRLPAAAADNRTMQALLAKIAAESVATLVLDCASLDDLDAGAATALGDFAQRRSSQGGTTLFVADGAAADRLRARIAGAVGCEIVADLAAAGALLAVGQAAARPAPPAPAPAPAMPPAPVVVPAPPPPVAVPHAPAVSTGMQSPVADAAAMPFLPDMLTIVMAVLIRKWWLIAFAVVAVLSGLAGALVFGSQTWLSEGVLLYKPADNELADEYEVLQKLDDSTTFVYRQGSRSEQPAGSNVMIQTLLNTVKIPSNLEAVRAALQLNVPLNTLGSAIAVRVLRDTELMLMSAEWDSPDTAQAIVTTLMAVFVEANRKVNRETLSDMRSRLASRYEDIAAMLANVEAELSAFADQYRVVDLQRESEQYIVELIRLRAVRDEAASNREALRIQLADIDRTIAQLRDDLAEERAIAGARPTVSQIESRIAALTRELDSNRLRQTAMAELVTKEAELERVKRLLEEGLASNAELARAQTERDQAFAATQEDDATAALLAEIDALRALVPTQAATAGPTEQMLRELELRRFDVQLSLVAAEGAVDAYSQSAARVQQSIDGLPALSREYVRLSTETAGLTAEVMGVSRMLAEVETAIEKGAGDFRVISEPAKPVFPASSNRRLLAVGIGAAVLFLGWGAVVMWEVVDRRLRSVKEAEAALRMDVLAAFASAPVTTLLPNPSGGSSPGLSGRDTEHYRILALKLRKTMPQRGAVLLVTSARRQAGKSVVVANLAAVWGRSDERVLVIDLET